MPIIQNRLFVGQTAQGSFDVIRKFLCQLFCISHISSLLLPLWQIYNNYYEYVKISEYLLEV